jgi:REP element-mobilizing transposase RayT
MTTQFRRERQSVTDLKIHLVCVTKYRRSVFTAESLGVIEKWSPSYFAISVGGASLEVLKQYIRNQEKPS